MNWIDHIKKSKVAHINKHLLKLPKVSKISKSKYGNKKIIIDDIEFASIKEGNRYKELKFLRKKGIIGLLELQVEFELNPAGSYSLKYIADFVYVMISTGEKIVEDTKGYRTREYKKKRRLMKKVHNITIKET